MRLSMTRFYITGRFQFVVFVFYCRDRWNLMDMIILLFYIVIFVLRMVTWGFSSEVSNNKTLKVASYLYGFNAALLMFRAFGHVMETTRSMGAIQIALFQIIGDIWTIILQFVAAITAFSIVITKVYVAERSYVGWGNENEKTYAFFVITRHSGPIFFKRSLTCTLGLTNDLIDDGQPRAKPHLRKVKPNHVLKTVFSPRLATVYQVVG